MNKKEIEKKYGKKLAAKIFKSGYMERITVTMNPDGTTNIPERDVELALKDVKGERIGNEEWD